MGTVESLGSIPLRATLLLVVTFVAGGLVGGSIDRITMVTRAHRESLEPVVVTGHATGFAYADDSSSKQASGRAEQRLEYAVAGESAIPEQFERLGLSELQQNQMRKILGSSRPEAETILRESLPRLRNITVETYQKLVCVLNAGQRKELASWRDASGLNAGETREWLQRANTSECSR